MKLHIFEIIHFIKPLLFLAKRHENRISLSSFFFPSLLYLYAINSSQGDVKLKKGAGGEVPRQICQLLIHRTKVNLLLTSTKNTLLLQIHSDNIIPTLFITTRRPYATHNSESYMLKKGSD